MMLDVLQRWGMVSLVVVSLAGCMGGSGVSAGGG